MKGHIILVVVISYCYTAACGQQRAKKTSDSSRKAETWWKEQQLRLHDAKMIDSLSRLQEPRKPSFRATNPIDKEVLEEFYHSTAGPVWVHNTGWLSGDPCQSMWYGIRCSDSGAVLEITLPNNRLAGQLPLGLSRMANLEVLKLYNNIIGGTIPLSLFTIKSLKVLDLDNNQLLGSLPADISMPYLKNLSIAHNQLQGYLPDHWNVPNLEVISLPSNMLQGPLPPALSSLSNLKYLDLSQNAFTGSLPPEYGSLESLEVLWLFTNLFDNAVIPDSWNGLKKMRNFQADSLGGDLPELIGVNWSDLQVLILVNGYLTGSLPESFCYLKKLQYLHIFNNVLTGPLPKCICDLPEATLTSIDLSSNQITGTIPDCFDNLHNLTYFYMENNNLTGHLPRSLGACKRLYTIDLSNNYLTGSIPFLYANLKDTMNWFELDNNKLNEIEDGLEGFFTAISKKFCSLYGNPWSCPLPDYFQDNTCGARCSKCNSLDKHSSCKACVGSSECGWCSEGPNCLEGYTLGPSYPYSCASSDWIYGHEAECNN